MIEIRTSEGLEGSMGKCGGHSVQKRQAKNRGAWQAAPQERSKKRGRLVRLSCVGPRVLG
ncbi:hypothetical protein F2Q69_00028898 [Brassica cretica]|uniref:Uncharacterized protein n=1 Tax=Brassica cretica TaxID=69181 RepID=A0A8S9S0J4_BRACR|nr:hypothetical protein F2Q69_00028898 [Brassica cretica]